MLLYGTWHPLPYYLPGTTTDIQVSAATEHVKVHHLKPGCNSSSKSLTTL